MKKPIIEFCMLNIGKNSNKAKEILAKDPTITLTTYGCLKKCSTCFKSHYALVNEEIITGDTPEQLVENVYQRIETVTVD